MGRRSRFLIILGLLLAMAAPWGNGQARAQEDAAFESSKEAAAERLKERAERVQERRKARVTQTQREAAAERAKAAREKAAAAKEVPAQNGKGAAQ